MRASSLVVLLFVCLTSVPAAAQVQGGAEAKRAVRLKYERANREYNLQNWAAALKEFQDLYREVSDPAFLFNIGQCQRQLGDFVAAAKSYRLYLSQAPDAKNAEQVRRLIDQTESQAKAQQAAAASPPPSAPPSAVSTVAASPTLPVVEVAAETKPRSRAWYKDPAGLGLAIGGVVAIATGGVLLGVAAGEGQSAFAATTQTDFDRHHGADLTYQAIGWPVLGVGIASIVVGTVVLVLRGTRHN